MSVYCLRKERTRAQDKMKQDKKKHVTRQDSPIGRLIAPIDLLKVSGGMIDGSDRSTYLWLISIYRAGLAFSEGPHNGR